MEEVGRVTCHQARPLFGRHALHHLVDDLERFWPVPLGVSEITPPDESVQTDLVATLMQRDPTTE